MHTHKHREHSAPSQLSTSAAANFTVSTCQCLHRTSTAAGIRSNRAPTLHPALSCTQGGCTQAMCACRSSCVCVLRCALVRVCMCVHLCMKRFWCVPALMYVVCMESKATGILCSKLPIWVCSAVWTLVHSYMGLLAAMYSCGMRLYILLIISHSVHRAIRLCVRACVC